MPFNHEKVAKDNYEWAEKYLTKNIEEPELSKSINKLQEIINKCGPVVDAYPSWHPLVTNHNSTSPCRTPRESCGYKGLDHTAYFRNGFITCPYPSPNVQDVIDSVESLPYNSLAEITVEKLDEKFYMLDAVPLLVRCEWEKEFGDLIPVSLALPLILEQQIPNWRWAQVSETWKDMRPYLIGSPHGADSSLFVSQETGKVIKKMWNILVDAEVFGPPIDE